MPFNRYKPISKETFRCDRFCGQCCKYLIVDLTRDDIQKIRQLGYQDEDFLTTEIVGPDRGKPILKKTSNGCVFLEKDKDGMYSCKIHSAKPEICRKYPFIGIKIEDCRPTQWPEYKAFNVRMKI